MKYVFIVLVALCLQVAPVALAADASLLSLPASSESVAAGLVTCSGPDCTLCSLLQMFDKIIDWLVGISMVLATIALAWSGFKMVYSQGPGELSKMKKILSSVIVGIILIMMAWMLIDTLMKVLVGGESEFGAWNEIGGNCGGMYKEGEAQEQAVDVKVHENTLDLDVADYANEVEVTGSGGAYINQNGTSVAPVAVSGMQSLRAAGVEVANWYGITGPGRTDLAHPTVVAAAKRMQDLAVQRYGKRIFQISAAYTNGVGHSAGSRHYVGIAVDFDEINGGTLGQIEALAREVGFTYILNEGNHIHGDMRQKGNAQ